MATRELRDRVDAQWGQQAFAWRQENHDRERKLIYDYVDQDENIMGLVGCTWGPASAFAEGAGLMMRQQRFKGVAVVTDLSVHFEGPQQISDSDAIAQHHGSGTLRRISGSSDRGRRRYP